jgi:hypothetical protein
MAERIIEVEADSLEEARKKAESQVPEDLRIVSEEILSDGKPRRMMGVADTTELAFAKAQNEIPTTADVIERKVLTEPTQKLILVEAFDEQNARSIAREQSRSQLGDAAIVRSVTLVTAGKKGFLGVSKKPNQYEVNVSRQAVVEVSYKTKAKISVKMALNYTRGLRPLGNKKRLTHTTDEVSHGYDVRLLLFRDKGSAEKYYDLFTGYARNNPPPFLIEIMLLFIPRSIFAEKYAVAIPHEKTDTRPRYNEWAMDAIRSCNNMPSIPRTDHQYKLLHRCVDVVSKWDILVPKDFSETSSEAKELLSDDPNEGFPPLKVLGQEGVTPPPETPEPQGPWVGVLFEVDSFDEVFYGKAATAHLLEVVGKQQLASCIIYGGDILPECRYWCSAVHTSSIEQVQRIEQAVGASSEKHLAPVGSRLLSGSQVPINTLVYQGFVSNDGVYVGK